MTLDQLHQQFVKAREEATFGWDWGQQGTPPHSVAEFSHIADDWRYSEAMCAVGVIARRITIARDFGELDEKRALMLWKLSQPL